MNGTELMELGLKGKQIGMAKKLIDLADAEFNPTVSEEARRSLRAVIANPDYYEGHIGWGELARELNTGKRLAEAQARDALRDALPYAEFGAHLIPDSAREQMAVAMRLPVSRRGALMPDAHKGYGLPIGGVLETENAVIPYGVGVDIGCSMMLTVIRSPIARSDFAENQWSFEQSLKRLTSFGKGCEGFGEQHEVLDDPRWATLPPKLRHLRDVAAKQLGSQGGGNHFVEWGIHTTQVCEGELALLSHFGSRGVGAQIAGHFTALAESMHPHLPAEAKKLAWLDLDTEEGQSYWDAMELAAAFARAGHELTHERLAMPFMIDVEVHNIFNTHNLAWRDGTRVIHRKGATPAEAGRMGIIPGNMADPAYVVHGLGNPESLNSASHGSGRAMGRREAARTLSPEAVAAYLAERGITKIGGGIDEAPQAYKSVAEVIPAQAGLVEVLGQFQPVIVRMADDDFSED